MAVAPAQRAFVLELFAGLGGVTARPLMGGLAIYREGRIFAIVGPGERLYLKAAGPLAAALAAEGSEQFVYEKASGKPARMGYGTVPDGALDDPDEACAWACRALDAADPGFS